MRELVTPDLDLIKQAKQGDVGVGDGRSRRSLADRQDCNQCGRFAADFAAEATNRWSSASMNGCRPPCQPGARPLCVPVGHLRRPLCAFPPGACWFILLAAEDQ